MTAKDYFAKRDNLDKPDTSQWQWGGTLGGPVVRDKAHFFGSLERVTIDEGITVNIPARPEFNATTTEATRSRTASTNFRETRVSTTSGIGCSLFSSAPCMAAPMATVHSPAVGHAHGAVASAEAAVAYVTRWRILGNRIVGG